MSRLTESAPGGPVLRLDPRLRTGWLWPRAGRCAPNQSGPLTLAPRLLHDVSSVSVRCHDPPVRDDDVRSSCFAALEVLCAKHGPEVPYVGGLDQGFAFRGRRVPFLNYQKGIYRAAAQRGPAALSVNTSYKSPYDDEETPDGFLYAYRAGAIDQPDNRALRAAHDLQVPLVYFVGTRPGWYRPEWPMFVTGDDPLSRRVMLTPGPDGRPVRRARASPFR